MVRAASVKQPGAEQFLHDFNRYGMGALDRYHQATGGLAGIPAPAMPEPALANVQLAEPLKQISPEVANNFRFLNVFDSEDMAQRMGGTRSFEKTVLNVISRNRSAIKGL